MKFTFSARKCHIRNDTKEYAEKKLAKLDKFFTSDCNVHVIFTLERENVCKVEATAEYGGMIFRAQEITTDFKESIDKVLDVLIRQIRKNKTKLEKRFRESNFNFDVATSGIESEPENEYNIIKIKEISLKPMSVDEAILQMNMLNHNFYVFINVETNNINVVYKRNDGDYSLIVTNR